MIELLDELSGRLKQKKVRASIYIVGGAAMALAFVRSRTTHDIDGRIDKGHGALSEAVHEIAHRPTRAAQGGSLSESPCHESLAQGTLAGRIRNGQTDAVAGSHRELSHACRCFNGIDDRSPVGIPDLGAGIP